MTKKLNSCDFKKEKIFRKMIIYIVSFTLIVVIFSSLMSNVSALSYNNKEIGYVRLGESQEIIQKADKIINDKIAEENVPVSKNIKVNNKYKYANNIVDEKTIAKKVLGVVEENHNKGYGIKIGSDFYCAYKNRQDAVNYYNNFISLLNKYKVKTSFLKNTNYLIIRPCYFKEEYSRPFSDIFNALELNLFRTEEYNTTKECRKIPDIYIYSPFATEDNVLISGNSSKYIISNKRYFFNEEIVSDFVISEKELLQGVPSIIETSDKNKITKYYSAEIIDLIPDLTQNQKDFLVSILPAAIEGREQFGIPIPTTLAQAILESAWGTCNIDNNIYGMKSYDENEPRRLCQTAEFIDGQYVNCNCYFKTYESFGDSVKDYIKLLTSYDRYKNITTAQNYIDACNIMGNSGYATSPTYTEKLITIIEKYHLYYWD